MTIYFLDFKDGKDTNSGLSWDEAFLTSERLDKELDKNIKSADFKIEAGINGFKVIGLEKKR